MGLIRTFVQRPVTTVMIVLVFVVLGYFSYGRMVIDLMPELEFPLVQIVSVYQGAGPEELESQIVRKIEDEVSNISDIKDIYSQIYEGYAWTIIEFELGVNVDIKALDVKDKVESIRAELPDAAEDPVVVKFDPLSIPVVKLALISNTTDTRDLYEYADKELKNAFGQVSGVAKVDLIGGTKRQINVLAQLDKLEQYGLTVNDLLAVLENQNLDIPAGNIKQTMSEIGIRFKGEAKSVQDIANLTFSSPSHGIIRIKDIARVEDGSAEATSLVSYNHQAAVILDIYKRADGNTIEVADGTYQKIEDLSNALPEGVQLLIAFDASTFIRDSVHNTLKSILEGIVLCSILLWLFLKNVRITLVAAVVLPTSIISAFMLMDFSGFTVNVLTLLALGISIGALVANAIVVLENIFRYIELGERPVDAAIKGTKEVAVAVMASAGTNIVVFTPIAFMGGIVGQFFFQFGLTVVYATMFSLLASFSLTPMLATLFIKSKETQKRKSVFSFLLLPLDYMEKALKLLQKYYGSFLGSSLHHPVLVVLSTVLVLIGSLYLFRFVGGEFFPTADESVVSIKAQMAKGTTETAAARMIEQIELVLKTEIPEMVDYTAVAGGEGKGFDEILFTIRLTDPQKRTRSDKDIFYDIHPVLAKIAGAEIIVLGETMGPSQADLDVEIYGPDYTRLAELAQNIRTVIMSTGNFRAVFNTYREPKDELHFRPDAYRRSFYEVPNAYMGMVLRNSVEGEKGSVLRIAGEEYEIKVRLDEASRDSVDDLKSYKIQSAKGPVPLSQLGDFIQTKGVSDLSRKNKRRVITLECFLAKKTLTENMALLEKAFAKVDFPPGYSYVFAGQAEMQQETFGHIATAFVLAIILTYMLLAAILNSFIHPLTIMITVPLGLVGVVFTLFFFGISLNLMSMMSIVMLVGIVVNNAILIIDYALQKLQNTNCPIEECVKEASLTKFRAILMTNLAIIAGIFPQILGGSGMEFMLPMAATTMGGIAISTLFTMFTIPVLFVLVEKALHRFLNLFQKSE
ncbi:efflux RND transporter permease subunit [bacterium]|nr:efflux RND transporter permease subunit [bacterium]